ncbi:uncharacterized protein F4807DRAFT_114978 [Annulohypoxylon truncatum]|uniref:uncharacterized protein n=1 Tax=Annulohypoxylon truncatum TaxID=327061 RepID=UPI0020085006|nr:uncharacterized protein F4807DRAFT_114978 [Annulohypoxylon truncatum]KAI1214121.1 hypothetical protein F4807DRAFT_114978 [Annulohypoxylon truncatum]
MLEKTAASLEPCGLQRVVPGAAKSLRAPRQLQSAFWKHGAADIELTSAWQALMHGTFDFNMGSTSEDNKGSALTASAFLLDFLYPTGAINLMRRLTPITPTSTSRSNSLRQGQRFAKLAPRLFTSSVPRRQVDRQGGESSVSPEEHDPEPENNTSVTETGEVPDATVEDIVQEADMDPNGTPPQLDTIEDDISHLSIEEHIEALDNLLKDNSDDPKDIDQIWHHYKFLDEPSQSIYLDQVLLSLSKSGRISDSWKISELFHKMSLPQWTNQNFVAGVTAEISLQNDNEAVEILMRGLDHEGLEVPSLIDALDLILASALRSSKAELLYNIWRHYPKMAARWDFGGIVSQLRHVSEVPGLAGKAFEFQTRGRQELQELQEQDGHELDQEALDTLQRILVRRALLSCADDQVIPLLGITNDLLAFEEFLRGVIYRGQGRLGTEVYGIYRDLPGSMPSHPVLHEIFKAYNGLNAPISIKYRGVELLWGDWHRFHTIPSRRAFQRYLAFYAAQGDTLKVYDLWPKLMKLYRDDPELPAIKADDTFSHLLHVHAVRGEVGETQRIFDDIERKFGIEQNTYAWNILLNAYAKAGDYDGAISTFEKCTEAGKLDKYSYGTMMQMAGSRGDLGFAIDLYRQGLSANIRANDAILSSLVDAYCQNNHLQAAEDVCVRAAKRGIVATRMWNKLLRYHALRRDLAAINKVLNLMADKEIPYNEFTYLELLLGLSLCRQSQHALGLLASALKDKTFEVTQDHFHVVMGALLMTGEPATVRRLHKLMIENGFPTSSTSLFHLARALGQYKNFPPKQRAQFTATEWLGKSLRTFYHIYGLNNNNKKIRRLTSSYKPNQTGELLGESIEKSHFSTMIYMLVDLKDFVQARELIDLYRYIFQGEEETSGVLPVAMLNAIMLADLQEKHYDRVAKTWDILFEAAKKEARSADYVEDLPHTPKISPKYRYVLSGGLECMQRMLFSQEDAVGIRSLIQEVRYEGFEVDSKNWNYYIQALVQLKEYKEAFFTCEKMLMPNWTGWFVLRTKENVRNKLSLDLRRKGSSPRHLRPVATTLYYLAKGYMDLDRLSPFSADMASTFLEIDRECVQVVRAIKSMIRVHSPLENEIFDEGDFIDDIDSDSDDQDNLIDDREGEVVR